MVKGRRLAQLDLVIVFLGHDSGSFVVSSTRLATARPRATDVRPEAKGRFHDGVAEEAFSQPMMLWEPRHGKGGEFVVKVETMV